MIKQSDFSTTLISSLKGAHDFFYDEQISDAMYYGLSGHAFIINISNGIGPCAPYLWDMTTFKELCKDYIGVDLFGSGGFINDESSLEKKNKATKDIESIIDEGDLVLLSSLEYQLITGYDDDYFKVTEPWKDVESVTTNLKKNTFDGIKMFLSYSRIAKTELKPIEEGVRKSIEYAIEQFENPSSTPDTAMGLKAYDFWLEKLNEENAIGHGIWWSSLVWAECRKMAAVYFQEISDFFDSSIVDEISSVYLRSSELLEVISKKDSNYDEKVRLIESLKSNELKAYRLLKSLL